MMLPEGNRKAGRFSLNLSLSLSLCLFLTACPEDVPVDSRNTTIHLSVIHEGTFSVQLKVSVEDSSDIWTFELTRDDSTVNTVTANQADTTLTDGSLNPGQTYRYRAYFLQEGEKADSSAEVYANTLDTTSHTFSWEVTEAGNYRSYLNDVAIVDEDNIWVVGNIETDSGEYNAARWDGNEWQLMEIINTADLYSIWYFNENDIWVTKYSYPVHWDGTEWTQYNLTEMGIPGSPGKAIWASSPSDIWFVGNGGSIVHYNGTSFEKMETLLFEGDTVNFIFDVYGWNDHVFLLGKRFSDWTYFAFELKEGIWEPFYTSDQYDYDPTDSLDYGKPLGIDIYQDTVYMATGYFQGLSNLIKYNYKTGEFKTVDLIPYYLHAYFVVSDLVVTNPNDIIVLSRDGKYLHYNGKSWTLQVDLYNQYTAHPEYYRINKKGNCVAISGYKSGQVSALTSIGFQY